MLSLRHLSFYLALLATSSVLAACGDDPTSTLPTVEGDAGAAGQHAAPEAGAGGQISGEGGEGGEGGSAPLQCCRAGVVCSPGQPLCAVTCPGSQHECAAGQVCVQGSDGVFDACAEACEPAQLCGGTCCALGATCSENGSCLLADLTISASDITVEDFKTVDVEDGSCQIQEGCFNDSGPRSVVSISATIENVGDEPFFLGAPWENPLFHASPCEDAYLLPEFIQAEVLDGDGEVIADGHLPTSCVADDEGDYRCTLQGLVPGGVSQQPDNACNTLDLTGLASGAYKLRLTVNPEHRFGEMDFANNSVEVDLEKPNCDGQICGGVCCPSGVECVEDMCMLPDLRVNEESIEQTIFIGHQTFGENSCEMAEMCVNGSGRRRLLQFEGRIENWGPGDLNAGEQENNPLFEFSDCHGHYHFLDFTDYRLLNQDGSVAAQGHKQAFCLVEMDEVIGATVPSPPGTHPGPGPGGCNYLGAGWADIYGVGTPCQWVDITDVPPGDYVLQVSVNPIGKIAEPDISNNVVQVPVQILEDTPCEAVETCGDNIDQDCDGVPDEWDDDCQIGEWQPVADNGSCDTAYELANSGKFQTAIDGDASSVTPSCGGAGGEAFFTFTLAESEVIFASSEYSDIDTVLALYQTDCSGADVICTDDDCGTAAQFARLLDPGTYVLAVKAKNADDVGYARLSFVKTGVDRGTLIDGPGVVAGDTSSSEDGVALSCVDFGGGECCQPNDPCNWANDGWCDCGNVFGWDDLDCDGGGSGGGFGTGGKIPGPLGGEPLGLGGVGGVAGTGGAGGVAGTGGVGGSAGEGGSGGTGNGSPDDVYFMAVCGGSTVQASTCGAADYDSALGIYWNSLDYVASSCTLVTEFGGSNQCSADPNGASTQSSAYDPSVAFVVVDAETEGASGAYQLYVSY